MKTNIHFWLQHAHLFLEWEMFQTNLWRQSKHSLYSITSLKNCAVRKKMWKNIVQPDRPHDNMLHARCMLNTLGYNYTMRLCNTYCFSLQQQLQEHASTLSYMCTACHVLITLLFVTLKLNDFYQTSYSLNMFELKHEVSLSLSLCVNYTCPIPFRYRASTETMTGATHTRIVTSFSISNNLS
jgi:hypothetical protein